MLRHSSRPAASRTMKSSSLWIMSRASKRASAPISTGPLFAPRMPRLGTQEIFRRKYGRTHRRDGDGRDILLDRTDCLKLRCFRSKKQFREAGHVGWINLNTIINEDGVWPLEFTCRFGYPGFAVLEPLQAIEWSALFELLLSAIRQSFQRHDGFSTCVVITTPADAAFAQGDRCANRACRSSFGDLDPRHLHFGEVGETGKRVGDSGLYGWTAVVTGPGPPQGLQGLPPMPMPPEFEPEHALSARYRRRAHQRRIRTLSELGWLKSCRQPAWHRRSSGNRW